MALRYRILVSDILPSPFPALSTRSRGYGKGSTRPGAVLAPGLFVRASAAARSAIPGLAAAAHGRPRASTYSLRQCGRRTCRERLLVVMLRPFSLGDVLYGCWKVRLFEALLRLFDVVRGRGTDDKVHADLASDAPCYGRDCHGWNCDYDDSDGQ